jgi:hypothetical protein
MLDEGLVGNSDTRRQDGLAMALISLADPIEASARGGACRKHCGRVYAAAVSARVLHQVLTMTAARQR